MPLVSVIVRMKFRLLNRYWYWRARLTSLRYKLRHWVFRWKQDDEQDIAFVLFNRIAFVKYKEHTIIRWDGNRLSDAGKYQGSGQE